MIKITNNNDLNILEKYEEKAVADFVLGRLLTDYQIDDIREFGSIFVISDINEFDDFRSLGLYEPINRNLEFKDTIHIKKCNQEVIILLGCIVVSDDYAIDIIVREDILTDSQKERFSSDIVNREYELKEGKIIENGNL